MVDDTLVYLAALIRRRNETEREITQISGRPAAIGHLGEIIAARIFAIDQVASASHKALDGYFTCGSLAGRSVNVKWYARQEGLLDITPDVLPDYYLVLTGPRESAALRHEAARPWLIEAVYCFDAAALVAALRHAGVKLGIATSVRQALWEPAQVYPEQRSDLFSLTPEQCSLLALFGGTV